MVIEILDDYLLAPAQYAMIQPNFVNSQRVPPFKPQRLQILCQLDQFVIQLPDPTNDDPLL